MDLKEVQRAWHVSAEQVYQMIEQGDIQAFAVPGRRKRYSVTDIFRELGAPTETDILDDAIAQLLATLERDARVTPPYRSRFDLDSRAA
jgi:hypothetical protein